MLNWGCLKTNNSLSNGSGERQKTHLGRIQASIRMATTKPANAKSKWVWVKIKPPGDRRFWSMLPLTRVPFWVPILDPLPNGGHSSTTAHLLPSSKRSLASNLSPKFILVPFHFHSFQASCFLQNHPKPCENSWCLKRRMAEKNEKGINPRC